MNNFDITVITPSYNMLPYLKRCVASVADQKGIAVEHIIIDNMSDDGTKQWLKRNNTVKKIIQPDNGIYDAINKGLECSEGDIFCYLNCDEQYLPGVLFKIYQFFNDNKDVDIVYGNFLLIDEENNLISIKKPIKPRYYYILSHYLYTYTCSIFFRRNIIDDGYLFSTNYKTVSDALFVANLVKENYKFGYINEYISVFTVRNNNLCFSSVAKDEQKLLKLNLPFGVRKLNFMLLFFRYAENFLTAKYFHPKPINYNIYVNDNLKYRKEMIATHVSPFYKQH